MNATTVTWTSLTSADLLISLRVPLGWDVTVSDETSFLVQGDVDEVGYRPTLSVSASVPGEPGAAWFDGFADAVVAELGASVAGFELIDTDRFKLSSALADVMEVRARRAASAGVPATSQIQAWVWANSYRMLVVGGSTVQQHEHRDLPLFDSMLRSLRLLPRRPAGTSGGEATRP